MAGTLTDKIYNALRDDIINLRIKPSTKLSEAKLAADYKVSRGPIRNVVQRLVQDELVEVKPQIGTIVMPISLQKARDILQVRLLLEPFAAEEAAKKAAPDELAELEAELNELERLPEDSAEKKTSLFAADNLLHQTIWRLCGNHEIAHIITNYKNEMLRIRLSTLELANRLTPSAKEMEHIFQTLKDRDPAAARQAMETHIGNIMKAFDVAMKVGEDTDGAIG